MLRKGQEKIRETVRNCGIAEKRKFGQRGTDTFSTRTVFRGKIIIIIIEVNILIVGETLIAV
jgi:hypothetical protein